MVEKAPRNPSSGLATRNPTHMFEADRARTQSDIVKSIKARDPGKQGEIVWLYDEATRKNGPVPMSGILKIRDMDDKAIEGFCKSLLRTRPNIYKLHIVLGDYPNKKDVSSPKVRALYSREPRFPSNVAEDIAMVLSDRRLNIVELLYEVTNTEPGTFSSYCKAYGVTQEEYEDDTLFSPAIRIEFIKAT